MPLTKHVHIATTYYVSHLQKTHKFQVQINNNKHYLVLPVNPLTSNTTLRSCFLEADGKESVYLPVFICYYLYLPVINIF